ncbi:hypothetical protein HK405_003494 [Cladochytrium tenue]|nr:hypothetical protein HK405_003494 [Cladochytrium tenue]
MLPPSCLDGFPGSSVIACAVRGHSPTAEEVHLAHQFFGGDWVLVPFIHPRTYFDTMEVISPALRLVVCAAGAILPTGADRFWQSPTAKAKGFFSAAKMLVMSAASEPTLELIQAALLLSNVAYESVTAPCSDDIWFSMDVPFTSSVPDPDPGGIVLPLAHLIELNTKVFAAVRGGLRGGGVGFPEQARVEESVAEALESWAAGLPATLKMRLVTAADERAMMQTVRSSPRNAGRAALLFVMYHGIRCLLLQRRCVVYLRAAGRAEGDNGAGSPAANPETAAAAARHRNEAARAFRSGRASARAVGRLLELLERARADLRQMARFRPWFILHAASTTALAREVSALGGHDQLGGDDDEDDDESGVVEWPNQGAAVAATAGHSCDDIDSAVLAAQARFLERMCGSAPSKPLAMVRMLRDRDWHSLALVERNPDILSDLARKGTSSTGGGVGEVAVVGGSPPRQHSLWSYMQLLVRALREVNGVTLAMADLPAAELS